MQAPEHRRGADSGEQPSRAAFELYQRRGGGARGGRRLLRKTSSIPRGDGPGKIDKSIQHMKTGAGHAAAGRLARVVAPAAFDARGVFVAKVAFDMQYLADRTLHAG